MKIRTGFGFDVHRLETGRPFFLGGVQIPHSHGALGHSDADVLIHALCDALLGAAGLGDIGIQFPDTDPAYKNIDSKILLSRVMDLLKAKNYRVGNVDATLVLEKPKISPYLTRMKETLTPILGIPYDDLSIKATTNEKMGFIGREEGVAAYAICLLESV